MHVSSGWMRRWMRRFVRDTSGGVLAFVAIAMVPTLGMVGLALDLGRAYVVRAQLSRAVDAGCLAGARAVRRGESVAREEALAVARANGVSLEGGAALSIGFARKENGDQVVSMTARRAMPTLIVKLLGHDWVDISSSAEAIVPPVDLVLVLDRSGSLEQQDAWRPLQQAAQEFVRLFDDNIDQLGLVSFQIRADDEFMIAHGFKLDIESAITHMNSVGDTNTGEGLRLAFRQLLRPNVRERSVKLVVFFTDGRPTAFRGDIGGEDRVLAVSPMRTGRVRGYFDDPDRLPMDQLALPDGCRGAPNCMGWNEQGVRNQARDEGIEMADRIRAEGFYVYTVALGNPSAGDPLLVPDLDYLKLLANEHGSAGPTQPQGRSYFAPSPAELRSVFNSVAQDLLVRLSR